MLPNQSRTNPEQARNAKAEMDKFVMKGRELEVVFAQEKRKTPGEMIHRGDSPPRGSDRGGMGNRSNMSGAYSQGGGSLNVSASASGYNSGIDSNRSGGGRMGGHGNQDQSQDVEPNKAGSSGGIEDLKTWLKSESNDKYK